MSFKFPKAEKICSKYEIDALFEKGKNVKCGSLTLKLLLQDVDVWPHVKFLVVVPKRAVKSAVDRNRLKRQLREVIRLNKNRIELEANKRLLIAVIYRGQSASKYEKIESSFLLGLDRIAEWINKN